MPEEANLVVAEYLLAKEVTVDHLLHWLSTRNRLQHDVVKDAFDGFLRDQVYRMKEAAGD